MPTLFTRIINGEIPCYKVAESEHCFAFLDINPKAKGHTLVIPKKEIDYLFDMSETELAELMAFAKRVAKAIQKAFPCPKVGMAVLGLEVPHAHIHLLPLANEAAFYNQQSLHLTETEFQSIAKEIAMYIEN